MKKLLTVILCAVMAVTFFFPVQQAEAASHEDQVLVSETVEYLPDGNILTITVTEEPVASRSIVTSKVGSKTYRIHNADGETLWEFILKGTFSINPGVSATCTNASYSYNIIDTNWNFVSASTSKSGNQAFGSAEFNRKILFIVVETETCDVTLTCDASGNLS